jgi:uncharacterized OB-fold protein
MERPIPEPTPMTAPFWAALREHRLCLQYSPSSDRYIFYPRVLAPGTLADDLEWRELSGRGVVYTFTVATRPTAPAWEDAGPQLLAVVELDEGPRLPTELVDVAPEDIRIGMRVRAVYDDHPDEGVTMLRFAPLQ